MAETKWTPGPWRRNGHIGNAEWIVAAKPFAQIATVYGPNVTAESDANAQLIAAAPGLYEALADIVRVLDSLGQSKLERVEAARAALAKARGE